MLLEQFSGGGLPQSSGQEHGSSLGWQKSSPQTIGAPQSIAQLKLSSLPWQIRSPQQVVPAGTSVQDQPPVLHEALTQGSGF